MKLVVYVGQDVGMFHSQVSEILFITTDDKDGREAWEAHRKTKDYRHPEIHKFVCENFSIKDWSTQ